MLESEPRIPNMFNKNSTVTRETSWYPGPISRRFIRADKHHEGTTQLIAIAWAGSNLPVQWSEMNWNIISNCRCFNGACSDRELKGIQAIFAIFSSRDWKPLVSFGVPIVGWGLLIKVFGWGYVFGILHSFPHQPSCSFLRTEILTSYESDAY